MTFTNELIKDAPKTWEIVPFSACGRESNTKNSGLLEDNLLSLSFGRIVPRSIDTTEGLLPESFETYQIVESGDIVFRFTDLQNDQRSLRSGLVTVKGIITSAYLTFRPNKKVIRSRYLDYLMRAYDQGKLFYSFGGGVRQSLKFDDVKKMQICLPPLSEQDAIVTFLDRELSILDRLIAKKSALSVLLTETKFSLISTEIYGQTPFANIIETPKLPASWKWQKLKHVAGIQNSNVDKKSYEGDIPVRLCNYVDVYHRDVIVDSVDFMEATATRQQVETFTLRAGQVLLTKDSESASDIGISAFVPEDLEGVICGYHLSVLTAKSTYDAKFLKLVLDSSQAKSHFAKRANGLTRVGLGQSALSDLPVPTPPLQTQKELSNKIWTQIEKLDAAIQANEKLSDLLLERRKALISDAVTGKIDVRGL